MKTYALFRYSLGGDEEMILEHESEQVIAEHALSVSYEGEGLTGFYTYRLQPVIDDEPVYENCRFFQNGREFTQMFKYALLSNIL